MSSKNEWFAWHFHKPVDYIALNLPDYPMLIKRPMDIETAKNKLD